MIRLNRILVLPGPPGISISQKALPVYCLSPRSEKQLHIQTNDNFPSDGPIKSPSLPNGIQNTHKPNEKSYAEIIEEYSREIETAKVAQKIQKTPKIFSQETISRLTGLKKKKNGIDNTGNKANSTSSSESLIKSFSTSSTSDLKGIFISLEPLPPHIQSKMSDVGIMMITLGDRPVIDLEHMNRYNERIVKGNFNEIGNKTGLSNSLEHMTRGSRDNMARVVPWWTTLEAFRGEGDIESSKIGLFDTKNSFLNKKKDFLEEQNDYLHTKSAVQRIGVREESVEKFSRIPPAKRLREIRLRYAPAIKPQASPINHIEKSDNKKSWKSAKSPVRVLQIQTGHIINSSTSKLDTLNNNENLGKMKKTNRMIAIQEVIEKKSSSNCDAPLPVIVKENGGVLEENQPTTLTPNYPVKVKHKRIEVEKNAKEYIELASVKAKDVFVVGVKNRIKTKINQIDKNQFDQKKYELSKTNVQQKGTIDLPVKSIINRPSNKKIEGPEKDLALMTPGKSCKSLECTNRNSIIPGTRSMRKFKLRLQKSAQRDIVKNTNTSGLIIKDQLSNENLAKNKSAKELLYTAWLNRKLDED